MLFQIEFPNLVRSGHGDIKRPADKLQMPGRTWGDGSCWSCAEMLARLLTCSRNCFDCLRLQVGTANQMVFGVSDVETIAVQGHSLWPIEARFSEGAIGCPSCSAAYSFKKGAVKFRDDEPVGIGIGDKESITLGIRQNLPRKRQRQITNFSALECQLQGRLIQLTAFAELGDRLGDHLID